MDPHEDYTATEMLRNSVAEGDDVADEGDVYAKEGDDVAEGI